MTNPPKINVVIRKRPLNPKEQKNNEPDIAEVGDRTVTVREMKYAKKLPFQASSGHEQVY